jgi:hypothetical protein
VKKKALLAFWIMFICAAAGAQVSYVTVSATVKDPQNTPLASAAFSIALVDSNGFPVSSASTPNGQLFNAKTVTGILDATGHFSVSLVPNNILTKPTGTQWKITITAPTDPAILVFQPAWTINYQSAITANIDLSSQLSALSTAPTAFLNLRTGQSSIAVGGGTVSGLTPGNLPLATGSTAIGKSSPLSVDDVNTPTRVTSTVPFTIPGITSDGAGALTSNVAIPKNSPTADIRAQGAVIDGVTDIGPALIAAQAQACTTAGIVLLPCTGSGCFLADGTSLATGNSACTGGHSLQYQLQGTLSLGSTLITPNNSVWVGQGQGLTGSFQMKGPVSTIVAPQVKGTLGTSVTASTSTPSTFTPTFTLGSISNVRRNTAITIADAVSCNISTISRSSTGAIAATVTTPCAIPAGTLITVAGVTDSSFNGTPQLITSDFVTGNMAWSQSAISTTPATSSGGTVTGIDDSTFETVQITAVSGSTATAYFSHSHTSAALWGMVGVSTVAGTLGVSSNTQHNYQGISVTNNWGAGWWFGHAYNILMDGVSATQNQYMPSIPIELASEGSVHITHSAFTVWDCYTPGNNSCPQGGYPMGMRVTTLQQSNSDGTGFFTVDGETLISGGVKIDNNGGISSTFPLKFSNIIIEQPVTADFVIAATSGSPPMAVLMLDNVIQQDNFMGYAPCTVAYTTPGPNGKSGGVVVSFYNPLTPVTCITNKYFNGSLVVNGINYSQGTVALPVYLGNGFTLNDGTTTEAELRGETANMGPVVIPYATQNVGTNPTTWTCSIIGGTGTPCAVNTGIEAPDGSFTAGEIVSGSGGSAAVTVRTLNTGTTAGDWILYGGWCMNGVNNSKSCFNSTGFNTFLVQDAPGGTDQFDNTASNAAAPTQFQSQYSGDWWHPVVAANKITTGQAGAHNILFKLISPTVSGAGQRFWQPFMIYVPVGAIPSNIAGSVAAGSFTVGETLTQATSGATAILKLATASTLTVNLITGSPDNSHTWTGGTSGATWTPTAVPVATMTTAQWDTEIARWRQQLLHGCIPAAATGGTQASCYALALPATVVQTNQTNTYTTGTQDFHSAAHTLPSRNGTTAGIPATCTLGEEYFATDALAGRNKYFCTATNTWTQQVAGSSPTFYNTLVEQVSGTSAPGFIQCASSGTGAAQGSTASSPAMYQYLSGSSSGNCAGIASQNSATVPLVEWRAGSQPSVQFSWAFSGTSDYTTNARIQLGLVGNNAGCTQAVLIVSGTPACHYAYFRYDTSLSDTVYQFCTDTASGTPNCQAVGSVAPTVAGAFGSISFAASNATVTGCINTTAPATSGTCVTSSTKVPNTSVTFFDNFTNATLTTAATHIRLGPIYGVAQGTLF